MHTSKKGRLYLVWVLTAFLLLACYPVKAAGHEPIEQADKDAFIAKVMPTCAVLVATHSLGFGFAYLENSGISFTTITFNSSNLQTWGIVIDRSGDILTAGNNIYDMRSGFAVTGISKDSLDQKEFQQTGDIKDVISKNINSDYVIVQSELPESGIQLPRLSDSSPMPGDTILIVQDPYLDSSSMWKCEVVAPRFDPFMGTLLQITTPEYVANRTALAYDRDGGLIGIVAASRLKGGNTVMVIPAGNLCRFFTEDKLSLREFSEMMYDNLNSEKSKTPTAKLFTEAQKLYWMGEYDSALAKMNQVLSAEPSHAHAQAYIAAVYYELGQEEQYEENLLKAAEMDDTIDEIHYLLANLYMSRDDTDKAIDAYKKAIDINGSNAMALYELGKLYMNLGKKGKTKRIYYDLKEVSPELAAELE